MEKFEPYLSRWSLRSDGEPIATPSSDLLPVLRGDVPAMLKLARVEEERLGGELMVWWGGQGAAGVLERDCSALLMQRATGSRSLVQMTESGSDDEATRIVCEAAAVLHAPKADPPPATLVPLPLWFACLEPAASMHGGIFRDAAREARALFAEPGNEVPLHGDLHHGNVLDFGDRGWLAIDPKGLFGERAFDFANLLCNPSASLAAELLPQRLDLVSELAGLERTHMLRWTLAWAGLSAAWTIEDGGEADLSVARAAAAELARI